MKESYGVYIAVCTACASAPLGNSHPVAALDHTLNTFTTSSVSKKNSRIRSACHGERNLPLIVIITGILILRPLEGGG